MANSDRFDRAEAVRFAAKWKDCRSERGKTESFWHELCEKVLCIEDCYNPEVLDFEAVVKGKKSYGFIDVWSRAAKVVIEQKKPQVDLDAEIVQSNGNRLTPEDQARFYITKMPREDQPDYLITCNFREFRVYDLNKTGQKPVSFTLEQLPEKAWCLLCLKPETKVRPHDQVQVGIEAGRIVRRLYDTFFNQLSESEKGDKRILRELNILVVRLIFCVYAEDAGVFGKDQFHNYLAQFNYMSLHLQIRELFEVLRLRPEERGRKFNEELKAFPWVGGGLFKDEIEVPCFTEEAAHILLEDASAAFDWTKISPTIFGAVFEATLDPELRRSGGMHYTSEENIGRVIGPLFLNDLKSELTLLVNEPNRVKREASLDAFRRKLGELKFLDPACGSGNFLTETYIQLRRLENDALAASFKGQGHFAFDEADVRQYVHVSINQFYGLEINDFAVTVAQTAMWIAECKMMDETNRILFSHFTPLPLTDSAKIREANALRTDWQENLRLEERLPDAHYDYLISNPPFLGARVMGEAQKADVNEVFAGWKNAGNLDYVCCWYRKAAAIMKGTHTRAAFVSTNSITQGEIPAILWKPLFADGLRFDFAYRTFKWANAVKDQNMAHVHCVILGFSCDGVARQKFIYEGEDRKPAQNINGYLVDAPNLFIESRTKPLCDVPEIGIGNKPIDGGFYLLSEEEKNELIASDPIAAQWIHPWIGSEEFLNGKKRYCLWLGDAAPSEIIKSRACLVRSMAVRDFRLKSTSAQTRKLAERPTHFHVENMPKEAYIVIPKVSSEKRQYIPMGRMSPETLCSDLVFLMPNASLYHFGVLQSRVHMAWTRAVCGRLETRYRYSKDIVYNNFPWPDGVRGAPALPETIKSQIEKTAQAILDARAKYPEASLADLYGEAMFLYPELVAAHRANDAAVMAAYGFDLNLTEPEIVAKLFEMYDKLTAQPNVKAVTSNVKSDPKPMSPMGSLIVSAIEKI